MTIFQGVDVSAYQGSIDWQRVKASHIDFVLLRATTGWSKTDAPTDKNFYRNAHNAAEAGIPLGAYHCSLAATEEDAHREAEFFLNIIRDHPLSYPAAIDIEDRSLRNLKPEQLDAVVNAWCADVRDAGYYPMIRAQLQTANNRLNPQTLREYDLWLLRHGETTDYDGDIGIWQYTGSGMIGGIKGGVSRNRALRDYPAIIKEHGLGGVKASPKGKASSAPASLFSASASLKQALDTLSELATLSDIVQELTDNKELLRILLSGDSSKTANKANKETEQVNTDLHPQGDLKPKKLSKEVDSGGSQTPEAVQKEPVIKLDSVVRKKFESTEDTEIQDEAEKRQEAKMLHGRWGWLFS